MYSHNSCLNWILEELRTRKSSLNEINSFNIFKKNISRTSFIVFSPLNGSIEEFYKHVFGISYNALYKYVCPLFSIIHITSS